ncbi:oxidoreductase [Halotia branconii]|uniref:Oxidoreductase n=1 Tax=Halotia branconii CENA392 TaxID=1539056 RepID=A0AAJ6NUF9_9CYAN|nr:oxidoreductase [Halotia branconii]WGV26842.1 oxidoreductase [Halotia branconii CENA392]
MNTDSKVWFITGSNSGFGLSLSKAVLAKGDKVVATTRHPEAIEDLVKQYSDTAKVVSLDVTKPKEISSAINVAFSTFGQIDVLVNNAGIATMGAVEEIADEQIRRQFEVNCFGTLNVIKATLSYFRQRKSGHIINISSAGGLMGFPGSGIYSATKFAIEGYSEALAQELAPFGVKLTLIEPGGFRTNIQGSTTTPDCQIDDYQESVHKFVKHQLENSDRGDPDKAAQAIIKVVESNNPPLHLLLGEDALTSFRQKLESFEKEIQEWEDVTLDTSL